MVQVGSHVFFCQCVYLWLIFNSSLYMDKSSLYMDSTPLAVLSVEHTCPPLCSGWHLGTVLLLKRVRRKGSPRAKLRTTYHNPVITARYKSDPSDQPVVPIGQRGGGQVLGLSSFSSKRPDPALPFGSPYFLSKSDLTCGSRRLSFLQCPMVGGGMLGAFSRKKA